MNEKKIDNLTEPTLPDGTLIKWPGINRTIYGVVENDGKSLPLVKLDNGCKFRLKDVYSSAIIVETTTHTISCK